MSVLQQCEAELYSFQTQSLLSLLSHLFSTSSLSPPLLAQLLSLGGRSRVAVSRILVGLQPQGPSPLTDRSPTPGLGPSIDMQRVQTLVEEMGSSLSPGAQSLMEMVNVQQKVRWSQAFPGVSVAQRAERVVWQPEGCWFNPQLPPA